MRIAKPVILCDSDRLKLLAISRSKTHSVRLVVRATIVLHAADGLQDQQIAPLVGMQRQSVARWRERFLMLGLDGLMKDLPRGGRTRTARAPDNVREVIRLTTQTKPDNATHWSSNSMAKAASTSATTVRRIWREHGIKQLEQTTVMIPPLGVITRQSTDVLAASDLHVVAALFFMWDHITDNLTVDQIAEQGGISRRKLERAFRRELGRGINQEFQRRRQEKARDLLVQTDLRITDISESLRFGSHNYFCRSFRAAFGVSATKFRRQHKKSA